MVAILWESSAIPAYVGPAQVKDAHAEFLNASYLSLDISN